MPLGRQKSDSLLAISVVATVLFGVVMIYSASVIVGYTRFHDANHFFSRQLIWAILGFIVMAITSNIDYQQWKKWAGAMLIITLVLLLSVFLFSKSEVNGAHRWIYLAGQSFQPSELAKFTFLVYISAWLCQRREDVASITKTFLPFVGILGVLSVLMLAEPDFGTLSIMLAAGITIYVVAGLTWKQFLLGIVVIALATSAVLAAPYRRARLTTFLDPTTGTSDISYHSKNIAIAIGSGGWFGKGFGNSAQKRLFLPEPHTDSIFAIITEELGFLISTLVILVYLFIVYRGYRAALRAPDCFGKLLAVGITGWFAFQAFINLASMLQVVPLVGVPLPFISYGGTNLVISLGAVGVLLNISRYGKDPVEKTVRPNQPQPRARRKKSSV